MPVVHDEALVVPDELFIDTLEDELCARITTVFVASIRARVVEALGGEPDPGNPLRRAPPPAPKAARLPRRAVKQLTRSTIPGADSMGTTDLHDVRPVPGEGGHPVESVAAHVHQAPALIEIEL